MSFMLQWSEDQHQFHVESIERNTELAIQNFLTGGEDSYVTLAIVPTTDEAHKLSLKLAAKRGLVWKEEKMRWCEPGPA